MSIQERTALYRDLEELRKRPLIVYVTNERPGIGGEIAGDVLPEFMDQAEALPTDNSGIDLLVVSNGGDPTVAFRIITILRERTGHIAVLIPQAAYSAATLLALGADEIVMHPNGNLGPVDPQIHIHTGEGSSRFAAEDVSAFLRFARDEVGLTDQQHLTALFQTLCNQVGPMSLGFSARASQLAASLGEKLLRLHMKSEAKAQSAHAIAESMCKDFYDHGYAVSRKEARQIGLKVAKDNKELENLMWKIWSDFDSEIGYRSKFSPMSALMQSAEGAKLASPVPQVTVPAGTPPHVAEQIYANAAQVTTINPIDVIQSIVFLESPRHASRYVEHRKVLAYRNADLDIEYNAVMVSAGWNQVPIPAPPN